MKLKNLVSASKGYKTFNFDNADKIEISGISFDSRTIKQEDIFVAIKGENFDGHKHIEAAAEKGAKAIVCENSSHISNLKIPVFVVQNSREALAVLAAKFYDYPARKMKIIGVTGTDGKTTTANLIFNILKSAGYKVGLITSINAVIGDEIFETGFHTTTPDAVQMQKYLAEMVSANTDYAVIESSSHGLAQHRTDMCEFDVAVITNITSEHLDYHKNFNDYKDAKAKLFQSLSTNFHKNKISKVSILNKDDVSFELLKEFKSEFQFSYGFGKTVDFSAENIRYKNRQIHFNVQTPNQNFSIETNLLGRYNISNILAAVAVASSQNISKMAIQKGIKSLKKVKGRMEFIEHNSGDLEVIIDFAHTVNALENALKAAKRFTKNKLILVFGCAGLRDKSKRKKMGEIAGKFADKIFITAEDPRTESVEKIMNEIAKGCEISNRKENLDFWKISDRKKAITKAILFAEKEDLVICCGKAQETTMCIGEKEIPWDEYKVVKFALGKRCQIN